VEPVLVNMHPDRKNIIISGHQRIKAAKSLGLETFPCVELSLDKDKERELNVRMNKNTGAWDWDELATYFDTEELTDWGFTEEELFGNFEEEELEAEEDDYEIPEEIQTDFVLGDLIEIGEHRLLCGDSTGSDQVAKLMDGEKADMVFTDPPYGVNYSSNWRSQKSAVKFDVLDNDDTTLDIKPIIILFSKESSAWYIWTSHQVYPIWREMFKDVYLNTIIWDKGKMGMGDLNSYGNNYEMALYCSRGKPKLKGERKKAIWYINIDSGADYLHPTQKPVKLPSFAIPDFTEVEELVLDLFLGSGSTMVACHQLNRKCYGMELDPKYCQVIVDRMLKLDPSLDVKVNGNQYTPSTHVTDEKQLKNA